MASNQDEASAGSSAGPGTPSSPPRTAGSTSRLAAAKRFGRSARAAAKAAAQALAGPVKILLAVTVLALVAVPSILFISNISDSAGAQGLKDLSLSPALVPPRGGSYFGAPEEVYPLRQPEMCVTLEFLSFNPTTSYATFGILLGATSKGKPKVTQFERGKLVKGSITKPIPRFKNVSLVIKSGIGLNRIVIPVPASALENAHPSHCQGGHPTIAELDSLNQRAAFRTTQNILVLGQPRAFPQDWYDASESVSVVAGRSQNGQGLPAALLLTSQDEDLSLRVHMDDPAPYAAGRSDPLIFTIRRPFLMQAYTYCIAALPFLLLISLLLYARVSKKRAEASDVALGVAATMVAILPLRQVLVPSSLPGVTRLDILFGLGISVLVALSIFIVIIIPPPAKTTDQSDQPGQDASADST
jgi:Domain of unknown function (DUF4436)